MAGDGQRRTQRSDKNAKLEFVGNAPHSFRFAVDDLNRLDTCNPERTRLSATVEDARSEQCWVLSSSPSVSNRKVW